MTTLEVQQLPRRNLPWLYLSLRQMSVSTVRWCTSLVALPSYDSVTVGLPPLALVTSLTLQSGTTLCD